MQIDLQQLSLPTVISAIGGLGTAAFGLLEALKSLPFFGFINRIGFGGIKRTVASLTPPDPGPGATAPINALPQKNVLHSLESNWINGNDLGSQKSIAKSLVKLNVSVGNAPALANATNVNGEQLTTVAAYIVSGGYNSHPQLPAPAGLPLAGPVAEIQLPPLTQQEADTWSRFDLIVTAMLDDCYQRADQIYRNGTRGLAALIAVILAVGGAYLLQGGAWGTFLHSANFSRALLVGLLATPLAPIAKDLSTALATAVNTMQLVKKP
jgi:hypothetical protein